MSKAFLSYDQQIQKLSDEKALLINDPGYAAHMLASLSYYSLIGGYKHLFKHPASGKYLRGVTFEEIVAFYRYDDRLRLLFLQYILYVEKHIKSLLSYHFCEKYGEDQSAYLTPASFDCQKQNLFEIQRLVTSLKTIVTLPTHYAYIRHHILTHGNVPLWVATNALSFGQVSKMYQYATPDIRTRISLNFTHVSEKQLHQYLTILVRCRNVCAHGERLYSFHSNEAIPDSPLHNKLHIPQKNGQYCLGKHDLFAVVLALRHLLDNDDFKSFKASLARLIHQAECSCPHIPPERLRGEMGFPEEWEKITRYHP